MEEEPIGSGSGSHDPFTVETGEEEAGSASCVFPLARPAHAGA
jgi:hypothetical protein